MADLIDTVDLMHKTAKGDQNAFRLLAHHVGPRLFRVASRLMGHDRGRAEDAVQEALIKLWRTAPNWKPTGSVEAYAARLVYTCCMDIHRATKRTEEIPETLAAPDNVVDILTAQQERTHLLGAIARLPANQRDAVMLFYMNEHSQRHVAAMMGTTEKAVERLLSRARHNLHGLLPPALQHERGVIQ